MIRKLVQFRNIALFAICKTTDNIAKPSLIGTNMWYIKDILYSSAFCNF
jgi:hypothetical protein